MVLTAPSSPTLTLHMLIPLYIYPSSSDASWDKVTAAASQIPITAIINPNSGPGSGGPNDDYQHGLKELRDAGVIPIGYVPTNYGSRPIDEVKADVDQYHLYFNLHGIFFDEVASGVDKLPYYKELYDYVKSKSICYQVFLNPGTQIDEGYISQPAGDTAVIFEGPGVDWPSYTPSPYVCTYSPDRFAALIHTVSETDTMRSYIDLAVARCIGYVYVTDDVMDNPWDSLPTYWEAEVSYIKFLNQGVISNRSCLYLPLILKNG